MPFKITKKGYEYDEKGENKLPPASTALQKIKGLVLTWETPVLPAKPKPTTIKPTQKPK